METLSNSLTWFRRWHRAACNWMDSRIEAISPSGVPRKFRTTSMQLSTFHTNICFKPLFTKFNWLSILVASGQLFTFLTWQICSIFQALKTAKPSPSDGWHACSRRCQLALDLTVRKTGFTYCPAFSGRLHCDGFFIWMFCVVCLVFVGYMETDYQ